MSAGSEMGMEDAQGDELDLQHDHVAQEELLDAPQDSSSGTDLIVDELSHENGLSKAAGHETVQQSTESESIDSLQECRTKHANLQLMDETHNTDETSSISDDIPSIQVLSSITTR